MARDKYGEHGPIGYSESMTAARFDLSEATRIRALRKSRRKVMRFGVFGVVTLVVLGVLMIVFGGISAAVNANVASKAAQSVNNPAFKVRYAQLGGLIVRNWYLKTEAPVATSNKVSWDNSNAPSKDGTASLGSVQYSESTPTVRDVTFMGGHREDFNPKDVTSDYKVSDPFQEVDSYYLVYNNVPQVVTINLLVPFGDDYSQPPILLANPSRSPLASVGGQVDGVSTDPSSDNLEGINLPAAVNGSLTSWAQAWASGNEGSLKQITQDSSNKVYRGLGGWTVSGTPTVVWKYKQTFSGDPHNYAIAEVSFTMQQSLSKSTSDGNDSQQTFTQTQVMDVLIDHVNSGLPNVVSWGPPGTWMDLKPYSVGIDPDTLPKDSNGNSGGNSGTGSTPTTSPSSVPTNEPASSVPTSAPTQTSNDNDGGE